MFPQIIKAAKSGDFDVQLFERAKKGDQTILNEFTHDILSVKYVLEKINLTIAGSSLSLKF